MLPVVTGRFLFSQAPDLLLTMWKRAAAARWLWAGRPDSAHRGLRGPASPGSRLGGGWPELPPTPGPRLSHPQQLPLRGRGQAGLSLKAEQVAQEVRGLGMRARGRRQGTWLWSQLCPSLTEGLGPSLTHSGPRLSLLCHDHDTHDLKSPVHFCPNSDIS